MSPHTKFGILTSNNVGDVPDVKIKVIPKQYGTLWHLNMYPHSKLDSYLKTIQSLTADTGVVSSIPAPSHTFMEIDHEIISMVILPLSLNHSRRVVVSYKQKYVHKVLVTGNCLFKLAPPKKRLGELTVPP